jgi:hypothetical protein
LRYKTGFSFLTRPSENFPLLAFHHRCPIVLDEAGATAWVDSEGDDVSALDLVINERLWQGSRLQPRIDSHLVALDTDSEGSAGESEEEEEGGGGGGGGGSGSLDIQAELQLLGAFKQMSINCLDSGARARAARAVRQRRAVLAQVAMFLGLREQLRAVGKAHLFMGQLESWEIDDVGAAVVLLRRVDSFVNDGIVARVIAKALCDACRRSNAGGA